MDKDVLGIIKLSASTLDTTHYFMPASNILRLYGLTGYGSYFVSTWVKDRTHEWARSNATGVLSRLPKDALPNP